MFRHLKTLLTDFKAQLPYLPRAFALVYKAAGALMIAWLALLLLQGLLPVAMVYLTKEIGRASCRERVSRCV